MAAQAERVARIRRSPELLAAIRTIRSTPDLWDDVAVALTRREELLAAAAAPYQRHRAFTPLLAAIAAVPRAADLLTTAIDDAVDRETNQVRRLLSSPGPFVTELVVGAGIHAAIYNAERQILQRGRDSLTIDARRRIGGQFAAPESPVWRMNSKNRPEQPQLPNLPGTSASLNSMGRCVLQESDISTLAYSTQDHIGFIAHVNNFFATRRLAVRTELADIAPNTEGLGSLLTTLRYVDTGQTVQLRCDRIIGATGIQLQPPGFAEQDDLTTRQLVTDEQAKPLCERRILTYDEFAERFGRRSNAFPLRGLRTVAVVGAGDGGRTVVGKLLGYQTPNAMSVPNLDRPEKVWWWGQPAMSKEEFVDQERCLYSSLGLEFPREQRPGYYHRIRPVARPAEQLQDELDEAGHPTGRLLVIGGGTRTPCDLVVFAVGGQDRTDEIFGLFRPTRIQEPSLIRNGARDLVRAGTTLRYRNGAQIRIDAVDPRAETVTYTQSTSGFDDYVTTRDQDLFRIGVLGVGIAKDRFASIQAPMRRFERQEVYPPATAEDTVLTGPAAIRARLSRLLSTPGVELTNSYGGRVRVAGYNEDTRVTTLSITDPDGVYQGDREYTLPLAVDFGSLVDYVRAAVPNEPVPVAVKDRDAEIYLVGPAASLRLTNTEVERAPALTDIPPNSASIFRNSTKVQQLAALFDDQPSPRPTMAGADTPQLAGRVARPRRSSRASMGDADAPHRPPRSAPLLRVPLAPGIAGQERQLGVDSRDRIAYALNRWASTRRFDGISHLAFEVHNLPRRRPSETSRATSTRRQELSVVFDDDVLARSRSVRAAISELLGSPDVQAAMLGLAGTSRLRPSLRLELPIVGGFAHVADALLRAVPADSPSLGLR
jgi:hypothetical protein